MTLTFDLHNRHTYSEELIKTNRAYRRYTATIGVLTLDNTLLSRAVVQNEFRTAADLVDRDRRRRRSRRREGGGADRHRADRVDDSGRRRTTRQHPRREARRRPARRRRRTTSPRRAVRSPSSATSCCEYRPAPARARRRRRDAGEQPARELLSIIVPVYNEVRTVRAVIDRLLAIDLPVAARDPRRRRRLDGRHARGAGRRRSRDGAAGDA